MNCPDVLTSVFKYLTPKELMRCRVVNKCWKNEAEYIASMITDRIYVNPYIDRFCFTQAKFDCRYRILDKVNSEERYERVRNGFGKYLYLPADVFKMLELNDIKTIEDTILNQAPWVDKLLMYIIFRDVLLEHTNKSLKGIRRDDDYSDYDEYDDEYNDRFKKVRNIPDPYIDIWKDCIPT